MKRALFALALAAALPMAANAAEVNNSYVQLGYQSTDLLGVDFDGFDLEGSVGFNDNWNGFASYTQGSKSGLDVEETQIGVGLHTSGEGAQWFGELSWVNVDLVGFDDDGVQLAGGVRGFLGEKFEAQARVSYADLSDFGERTGAGLQGVYHFNDTWGMYGNYEYADYEGGLDTDTFGLGVRASF